MNSLLTISFQTKIGLYIYSSKIIPCGLFYIKLLNECNKEGVIKIRKEKKEFKDILSLVVLNNNEEEVGCFKKLYGNEFHSCKDIDLFNIIDSYYKKEKESSIFETPLYNKFYELYNKFMITDKILKLSIKPELVSSINSLLKECEKLLNSPIENESIILNKLQEVLTSCNKKNINISQPQLLYKSEISKVTPLIPMEPTLSKEEPIVLKNHKVSLGETGVLNKKQLIRNNFGQFIYSAYNFIYDPLKKIVIGKSNLHGGIIPFDVFDYETCDKAGLKY